jgi:hypothetical protein
MRACKLTNDISKVIILNQSKINFMSDGKKNRKISSIQEYTVQVETIQARIKKPAGEDIDENNVEGDTDAHVILLVCKY